MFQLWKPIKEGVTRAQAAIEKNANRIGSVKLCIPRAAMYPALCIPAVAGLSRGFPLQVQAGRSRRQRETSNIHFKLFEQICMVINQPSSVYVTEPRNIIFSRCIVNCESVSHWRLGPVARVHYYLISRASATERHYYSLSLSNLWDCK